MSTSSAPTVVESKWNEAQPTVLERQIGKKKPNVMMMSGIAAVIVIAIAVGAIMLRSKPQIVEKPVVTTTTSGTSITVPGGQGVLLLSASPWGDIDKIVNEKNNAPIDLNDEKRSTPTGISLDPGSYLVTVKGPNDLSKTLDVQIKPGQNVKKNVDFGAVNLDDLQKEVTKQ